jgi:hypothetical protein
MPGPAVDHAHVGGQLTHVSPGATADRRLEWAAPHRAGEELDIRAEVR